MRCKYCGTEVMGRTMCLDCYNTVYKREQYRKHRDKRLAYMRAYRKTEAGKKANLRYKDKDRHGGLKRQVLRKCGFKCVKCGKDLRGLSRDTIVHHKDGLGLSVPVDERNHALKNQIVLCRSCHASVHHAGKCRINFSRKQLLEALSWGLSMEETAKKLGIARSTLYAKRKLHNLV